MRINKIFLIAFLLAIILLSSSITAFAKNEQVIISEAQAAWLQENITGTNTGNGEVTGTQKWITKYITVDVDGAAKENERPIAVGNWSFGNRTGKFYLKKGKTLESLSKQINRSMNDGPVTERITGLVEELGIHASTGDAVALFSGFVPLLNLILGAMVTLITVGMTFFSAMDIAYIAFPVFRNFCEEKKDYGGTGTKKTANGETKLLWVTDDAQNAVKKGLLPDSTQSPWSIYFKQRIMSYIMLAITLFILMTGNITLITNIATNIVSGIMDVLVGLAA